MSRFWPQYELEMFRKNVSGVLVCLWCVGSLAAPGDDALRTLVRKGFASLRAESTDGAVAARQSIVAAYLQWVDTHAPAPECATTPNRQVEQSPVVLPVSMRARAQALALIECLKSTPAASEHAQRFEARVRQQEEAAAAGCRSKGRQALKDLQLVSITQTQSTPCTRDADTPLGGGPSAIEELFGLPGPPKTELNFGAMKGFSK